MDTLQNKLHALKTDLKGMESVLVAFSGGVDSTFLLTIARQVLGNKVCAVTATSPTYPLYEYEEAVKYAETLGVPHLTIESNELENAEFRKNTSQRCYYCKTELFGDLVRIAREKGFKQVVDASNADDVDDYRPGMKAAKELGVKSPLMNAGITKQEIRTMSREMGLATWNKPSFACLASRFPYGTAITEELVSTVYKGEVFLRENGFRQFRVRHHAPIVRLELDEEGFMQLQNKGLRNRLVKFFKELGYLYVTVDIQGYRTGSLNEGLGETGKKPD